VLSAAPKLRRPAAFCVTVARYELVPGRLARPVALAVIAIEAFLAVCLLSGALLTVAVPLAIVTVLGFGAASAINLRRGRDIECGCFGNPSERVSVRSLARLGLVLAAAVALAALAGSEAADPITAARLADEGADGLAYLINIAGVAAFLLLGGMWLLHGGELNAVVRGRSIEDSEAT
jgi:hypothetical protein